MDINNGSQLTPGPVIWVQHYWDYLITFWDVGTQFLDTTLTKVNTYILQERLNCVCMRIRVNDQHNYNYTLFYSL